MKLGDQLETEKFLKKLGIDNLNSVTISHALGILASQNRFKTLYDEILNIERL